MCPYGFAFEWNGGGSRFRAIEHVGTCVWEGGCERPCVRVHAFMVELEFAVRDTRRRSEAAWHGSSTSSRVWTTGLE